MTKISQRLYELERRMDYGAFDCDIVCARINSIFTTTKVEHSWGYDYTEVGPGYNKYFFYMSWIEDNKLETYTMSFEF